MGCQEKPQIDEVESRLRTAINLQETGALLKAIKLAKRRGSYQSRVRDIDGYWGLERCGKSDI